MRFSSIGSACFLGVLCTAAAIACADGDEGGAGPKGASDLGGSAGASDGAAGDEARGGQGGTGNEAGAASGGGSSELEAVTIRFKAKMGNAEFACGQAYEAQGTVETTVLPQDLRFFVERVRLIDADDNEVPVVLDDRAPFQSKEVALLDFEDGSAACINGNTELNSTITGKVPPGNYVGIVFSTAVPEHLNHADPTTLPAPLQAGGLSWGWLFGYRFIVAEVVAQPHHGGEGGAGGHGGAGATAAEGGGHHDAGAGGADSGHGPSIAGGLFHLGSIECSNSEEANFNAPPRTACAKPFRNEIRLEGFNARQNVIVADVGALFSDVDLSSESTCHSFGGAACPTFFKAVGLDYATGDRIHGQTFFRVAE
ncbi:MAG: hypothetical protein K0R38_7538 [Polyangiaceae bacterium]|jgi:uncharacterized repeat protein (TIGR04052 family)|nr:hypothetical protein [Polyangiaceae bacterium]